MGHTYSTYTENQRTKKNCLVYLQFRANWGSCIFVCWFWKPCPEPAVPPVAAGMYLGNVPPVTGNEWHGFSESWSEGSYEVKPIMSEHGAGTLPVWTWSPPFLLPLMDLFSLSWCELSRIELSHQLSPLVGGVSWVPFYTKLPTSWHSWQL